MHSFVATRQCCRLANGSAAVVFVMDWLEGELGIEVARCDIGAFFCSQEMAGFSISLLKLDDQLEHLLNAPCESITFTQG